MHQKPQCHKMFALFFVVLALIMGILVSVLPQEQLANLFYVSRFIEVMIPILGVGALIKYLFCGMKKSCCTKCGAEDCKCGSTCSTSAPK